MGHGDKLVTLTRLGFAARGLLYLIIAWLLISSGRSADLGEALTVLASGKQRVLLFLVIAGFIAYGLWRLADTALDSEGHGTDGKGLVKRAGAGASGVIYLFLAYQAYKLLDGGNSGGSGDGAQEQAQNVLELPGGWLLLAVGAAILLGAGVWQLVKAAKASFLKHLEPRAAQQESTKLFGRVGYAARGVIFIVTGFFLSKAALSGRAEEAGGMEAALQWLASPMNLIVAAGLALFGLFSLIEARYRIIRAPSAPHIG